MQTAYLGQKECQQKQLLACQPGFLISSLLFLYFFTLSADVLNIQIFLFKLKLNNIFAILLLAFFLSSQKFLIFPKKMVFPFLCILFSMGLSSLLGCYKVRSVGYLFIYIFNYISYFVLPF
jgi:hypothetical protein